MRYFIKKSDGDTLYESLKNYVKCNEEFTKGVDFLEKLNRVAGEVEAEDSGVFNHHLEASMSSLCSYFVN